MTEAELQKIQAVEDALDSMCGGCAHLALTYGRPCGTWECQVCGTLFSACACPVGADEQEEEIEEMELES